jgi:hypothetical protein
MIPSRASQKILDIYDSNRQTECEKKKKEEWRNDLQRLIRRQFPNLRLVLAGSSGCGLATQGSDCDFTLIKVSTYTHGVLGVSVLREIQRIVESDPTRNRLETEVFRFQILGGKTLIISKFSCKFIWAIKYKIRTNYVHVIISY